MRHGLQAMNVPESIKSPLSVKDASTKGSGKTSTCSTNTFGFLRVYSLLLVGCSPVSPALPLLQREHALAAQAQTRVWIIMVIFAFPRAS